MMSRVLRWVPALLALAAGGALLAQEQVPPPPEAEGIRLAYKFVPGRKTRTVMTMKGDLAMGMEGGPPGAPNQIPIGMDMTLTMLQKVLGARNGVGTVLVNVDTMRMQMEVFGMQMLMRLQNGKLSMSMNGQPMPLEGMGAGAPPGMPGMFNPKDLQQPITMRINRQGKVLSTKGPPNLMGGFPGAGQMGMGPTGFSFEFPNRALAIGEAWEDTRTMKVPFQVPGGPGAGTMEIQLAAKNTLRNVITKGARRLAIIDSECSMNMPSTGAAAGPIAFDNMNMSYAGASYFDLGLGDVSSASFAADLSMGMSMNAGAFGAPGGPGAAQNMKMTIDGGFKVTVRNTPATAARPPARRSATRRGR